MKVLTKIKEGSQRLRSSIREMAMQESPKRKKKNPLNVEWDQIYVEIDNDANGTIAAENLSPTRRRRNVPIVVESESEESGSISKLHDEGENAESRTTDSRTFEIFDTRTTRKTEAESYSFTKG